MTTSQPRRTTLLVSLLGATLLAVAFASWLALSPAPKADAAVTAFVISTPIAASAGVNPYETKSISIFVDPATTNWIAWNDTSSVVVVNAACTPYAGNPAGGLCLGSHGFGTNDFIRLTVTPPVGIPLAVLIDQNDSYGFSFGPQMVIFGTAANAPDVRRITPFGADAGHTHILNEAGSHNAVFTTAGTYTFKFEFFDNDGGFDGGHGDVFLLVDTGVAATATPTSTPTDTPTATPTNTPTATATPTNAPTDTPTATATPTNTPTDTPRPTATPSPTATQTATNTGTPTRTATATATSTPTSTRTPRPPVAGAAIRGVTFLKTASLSTAAVGDTLIYTLTLTNGTGQPLTEVAINDSLPSEVTVAGAIGVDHGFVCVVGGSPATVSCSHGAVADGDTATITITTTVSSCSRSPIRNGAQITSPNVANGPAFARTRVSC